MSMHDFPESHSAEGCLVFRLLSPTVPPKTTTNNPSTPSPRSLRSFSSTPPLQSGTRCRPTLNNQSCPSELAHEALFNQITLFLPVLKQP